MEQNKLTEQQEKARQYVVENQERLLKRFGDIYIEVGYRNTTGGLPEK